jgi:methylated-DNA-[protein]-cysteine S-methyltransferase
MTARTSPKLFSKTVSSPVGMLWLYASDAGLAALLWRADNGRHLRGSDSADDGHPTLLETERQLGEYFSGRRKDFDLALDFRGTDFQRRVWSALLTIPYGETRTYAQVATQIGHPSAVRAVGAANGRNPISIIAPCHRVIGSSGALTGFGGGLPNKAKLLALESAQSDLFSARSPNTATRSRNARETNA